LYRPLNSKGDPDEVSWQKNPEYFTACSARFRQIIRIFIAPMPEARELIRFAEGALIWTIWDYECDHWGNRPNNAYYFISWTVTFFIRQAARASAGTCPWTCASDRFVPLHSAGAPG
jgi:hypothetical protein